MNKLNELLDKYAPLNDDKIRYIPNNAQYISFIKEIADIYNTNYIVIKEITIDSSGNTRLQNKENDFYIKIIKNKKSTESTEFTESTKYNFYNKDRQIIPSNDDLLTNNYIIFFKCKIHIEPVFKEKERKVIGYNIYIIQLDNDNITNIKYVDNDDFIIFLNFLIKPDFSCFLLFLCFFSILNDFVELSLSNL